MEAMTYEPINNPDRYEAFKVIMLGYYESGKGSVLHRYLTPDFFTNKKCMQSDINQRSFIVNNDRVVKFEFWDFNGNERTRKISDLYYRCAHGYIIVYDVTNKKSFEDIPYWLNEIKKNCYYSNPPIIIIGNKYDLIYDNHSVREIDSTESTNYFNSLSNIPTFQNVSAKENINIAKPFDTIIKSIINKNDFPPELIKIVDKTTTMNNDNKLCNIQ